jgi:hypothetical protein
MRREGSGLVAVGSGAEFVTALARTVCVSSCGNFEREIDPDMGVESGFVSDPTTGFVAASSSTPFYCRFCFFLAWVDSVRAGHAVSIG